IITAIIAILLFFPFVFLGGTPFQVVMYLIGTIGFIELLAIKKITSYKFPTTIGIVLVWIMVSPYDNILYWTKLEFLLFVGFILLAYTVIVKNKYTFDDVG